jgi:hypothetical protein
LYLGLGAIIAGILSQLLPGVLPPAVATRIEHNSEGFVAAMLLVPWIQFVRPRLAGRRWEWPVTFAAAAACAAVGVLLVATDLPSRFRTLNEAFLALAVLIPYVQPRRPLPPWVPWAVSGTALAAILLGLHVRDVVDQAETFALLLLAPVAFDLVDRAVLDPAAAASRWRYAWYAFLVAAPIAITVAGHGTYPSRTLEAFVFLLLVEPYFAAYRSTPDRTRTRSYV